MKHPYCRVFWDYYGPSAKETAQHFMHHLLEFIQREQLQASVKTCELEEYTDIHVAVYCDAEYEAGRKLAMALKSKRSVFLSDTFQVIK